MALKIAKMKFWEVYINAANWKQVAIYLIFMTYKATLTIVLGLLGLSSVLNSVLNVLP